MNFYGILLVEGGLLEVDKNGWVLVENEDWQYVGERICTLEGYFLQGKSKQIEQYIPLARMPMIREREVPYAWEVFNKPEKVAENAKGILHGADKEYLLVLSIDSKCRPVAVEVVSIGTVNVTLAEPREIFKHAILVGAAGIILAHNHVSGDRTLSGEDTSLTGEACGCGKTARDSSGRSCDNWGQIF